MKVIQIDLNKDYSEAILEAVAVLNAGGVIIYPTDTLYGLGANALDPDAVEKVFAIKGRDLSKPLPIIVKNIVWADELAHVSPRNVQLLKKAWPGKFTAILPKKNIVPDIVDAGQGTIGVRVPDFPFTDKLLGKFGYPLTATSANISGREPTNNIDHIIGMFSGREIQPDLIMDVGVLPPSEPSVIVDLTTSKPKILRVSQTKPEKLLKLLELTGS